MSSFSGGDELEQAASHWDAAAIRHFREGVNTNRAEWQGHPACERRRDLLLGGMSSSAWLAARLPPRVDRALGAGCGQAGFELSLLALGIVQEFDLFDVSAASLEHATREADRLGVADRVHTHVEDMLFAEGPYDLVTFVDSLHHATDVTRTVRFAYDVLKPGGFFFADEYVGPRRFAYPSSHSGPARGLYRAIHPALRGEWPELPQFRPEEVEAADPTEAVESDLIMGELRAHFPSLEIVELRGALPFMIWWGLDHDALWDSSSGRDFVELLLQLDDALALAGRLPSYFSIALGRK